LQKNKKINNSILLGNVRKSAKEIIISQLKTGDIIKVKSNFLPIIFHYGIVVRNDENFVVYHNDPERINLRGGNIIKENTIDWIKDKEIVEVISTNHTIKSIEDTVKKNIYKKYDFFNYNCEHFVLSINRSSFFSPQVLGWSIFLSAAFLSYYILRKKQNRF